MPYRPRLPDIRPPALPASAGRTGVLPADDRLRPERSRPELRYRDAAAPWPCRDPLRRPAPACPHARAAAAYRASQWLLAPAAGRLADLLV